jgi:hypothetical protein
MRAVKLILPFALHAIASNGNTHQPDPGSVKVTVNSNGNGILTMDPGVSTTVSSSWYLEDASTAKSYSFAVESGEKPHEGMFENSTTVSAGERIWSRCTRTQSFTFSSRVRMESANKSASGYIDDEWEAMSGLWLQLGLLWRECQE